MDVRTDGDIADSFWWRRTTLTRRTPLYDACVSVGLLVAATIVGALARPSGSRAEHHDRLCVRRSAVRILYLESPVLLAELGCRRGALQLFVCRPALLAVAYRPRLSRHVLHHVRGFACVELDCVGPAPRLGTGCRQRPPHAYGARDQPHAATVRRSAADCPCHGHAAGASFGLSGCVVQRRRRGR